MTIQRTICQEAIFCLFFPDPTSILLSSPKKKKKKNAVKCSVNAILKCQTFVIPSPQGNRQQACSCGKLSLSGCLLWSSRRGFQAEKVAFRLITAKRKLTSAQCGAEQQKLPFQTKKKLLPAATSCLQSKLPLQTRGTRNTRRLGL